MAKVTPQGFDFGAGGVKPLTGLAWIGSLDAYWLRDRYRRDYKEAPPAVEPKEVDQFSAPAKKFDNGVKKEAFDPRDKGPSAAEKKE